MKEKKKKEVIALGVIIVLLFTLVLLMFPKNISKGKTIIKNGTLEIKDPSMVSLMLEKSVGSGEYIVSEDKLWPSEGYSFNSTLSKCENGSELIYNEEKRAIELVTNKSDKCYVYFDIIPQPDKYWNDGFGSKAYSFPETPSTVYTSIEDLQVGYSEFESRPFYIKTTATEHLSCLYYNNREFCFGLNYWDTDGSTTKQKLQTAMATALGLSTSDLSCSSGSNDVDCNFSGIYCYVYSDGHVYCFSGINGCRVNDNGSAHCF